MKPSKHESVRPKAFRALRVRISVSTDRSGRRLAFLDTGAWRFRCSIGKNGLARRKREGDGRSPIGSFAILAWRIRPAQIFGPRPPDRWRMIDRQDGWCDDPASGAYNREIRLPSRLGHEKMWRDDQKYDVVAILDYNIRARAQGLGSAIFFHLCSDDYEVTAGCVAVTPADMRKLLARLGRSAVVRIG